MNCAPTAPTGTRVDDDAGPVKACCVFLAVIDRGFRVYGRDQKLEKLERLRDVYVFYCL